MNWTLVYRNEEKLFKEWGLSKLKRTRFNQGVDRVSFLEEGKRIEERPLFDPESKIIIKANEKIWFQGILTKLPSLGYRIQESRQYVVSGPAWYLQNLVFEQEWNEVVGIKKDIPITQTIRTGRVILGQNLKGEPIDSGTQIKEILEYAIAQGAPIQIGEIGVNVFFPYDETKDISCAEAIQRLLRWTPDAALWFDYSTLPYPTLHIQQLKSMSTQIISLKENPILKTIKATPRYDLQCPSVVLKYEKTHLFNGQSFTTTQVDRHPENGGKNQFKALVLTIELDGAHTQTVKQAITSQRIEIEDEDWWLRHLPSLNKKTLKTFTLKETSRLGSLPYELISGSIANWMQKKVEEDVIRATLSYETDVESVINKQVAIKIYTTDAKTRTYERALSSNFDEEVPKGLAQALYEALNQLMLEGEVTLEEEEISFIVKIGDQVRVKEMGEGRGIVQAIYEEIDKGQTYIKFGPAKHIGADDLVELLRVNRKRQSSRSAIRRTTGNSPKVQVLEQGTHSRIENTDQSGGSYEKVALINPERPKRRLILDAKAIVSDTTVTLKEETVCENGVLKKRLVLASDPYERRGILA